VKKILIAFLIVLLIILTVFALTKGIKVFKINSVESVKTASDNLDKKYNEANELSSKTYPNEVDELKEAIKSLKSAKKEYENKNVNSNAKNSLNTISTKTFKIHYLWVILGNYRKDRGVQTLNLDLKATQTEDVYDLQFTLLGTYTSIIDFIYDIENDDELNFEINNFTLTSTIGEVGANDSENNSGNSVIVNSNKNTVKGDGTIIQAKFTVKDVGKITLD